MTAAGGRPITFAEALREVAAWLDVADSAFEAIVEARRLEGKEADYERSDAIQRDLRAMADLLDDDLNIGSVLDHMWNERVPA